jgi:integrase
LLNIFILPSFFWLLEASFYWTPVLVVASVSGMDLFTFSTKYLDYAERFSKKVYQEKKAVVERILSAWGPDTLVMDITAEMAEAYLMDQKQKRSANASNKDRKNLHAMFAKGKTYGIRHNPFADTEKFPHDGKPQYTPPNEDVEKLLEVATRAERVFLDCYLQTAARRSEIFRWTWIEDINFDRRAYRLGTRKTRDGSMEYEWFPMSDDLYESLWWQWQNRKFKRSPYVFVSDHPGPNYGKPFTTRRKFMKGLCKRAGVTPFGFHALRRYVASILVDQHKASLKTVQRILRHKKMATTERYVQALNDDLRQTMNLLSRGSVPESGTRNKKEATDN